MKTSSDSVKFLLRIKVTQRIVFFELKQVLNNLQVSLLVRVFRRIRQLTMERRGLLYSGTMQLMDNEVQVVEEKDLLFDPNDYKSRYQVFLIVLRFLD